MARFRENFRAFGVGGFWIAPVWDPGEAPPGRRLLLVDPGRAFGTGTHESTALCLQALEELAAKGPLGRVLDVGTGSGILAIAASKLGATRVMASDLDPESIESAQEHAARNEAAIRLVRSDGGRAFRSGTFDTVLANLTAPLLIEKAKELSGLLGSGGRLILAGLLANEHASVSAAYPGLQAHTRVRDEWSSLILERP